MSPVDTAGLFLMAHVFGRPAVTAVGAGAALILCMAMLLARPPWWLAGLAPWAACAVTLWWLLVSYVPPPAGVL